MTELLNGARVLKIQNWFEESQAGKQCKGTQTRSFDFLQLTRARCPLQVCIDGLNDPQAKRVSRPPWPKTTHRNETPH